VYQVGALNGFLLKYNVPMNHVSRVFLSKTLKRQDIQVKPHGALYGVAAREIDVAKACVRVAKLFGVPFMGLAGTQHQVACKEEGVKFLAGKNSAHKPKT
jgi:lactam utilization protein B